MANIPSSVRRALWLGSVTLPLANTNYQILDLVNTALAAQTGNTGVVVPGSVRELLLQANPGIDGIGANTKDILVGDAALSTTNYGFVLSAGSSAPFRSGSQNVFLGGLYVRSSAVNQILLVTAFGA